MPGGYGRGRRRRNKYLKDDVVYIDYKNVEVLKNYVSDRFKIDARRKTGTCSRHQSALAAAIKRARIIALLPYSPNHQGMYALPRR